MNKFSTVLLRWAAGFLVIFTLGSRSAPAFEIGNYRVFVHPDLLNDVPLETWSARVQNILNAAQALLCKQCELARAGAHQPKQPCTIRLQLADVQKFTRPVRRAGRPTAVLDWSEINEVFSWGGRVGERTVYLVRGLRLDPSEKAPHWDGLTSMRVSLVAVGGEPHAVGWLQWQAAVWAHELGHGLGLADLDNTDESDRLMYNTTLPKNRTTYRLTVSECGRFENAF